jgi:hypothetical protein
VARSKQLAWSTVSACILMSCSPSAGAASTAAGSVQLVSALWCFASGSADCSAAWLSVMAASPDAPAAGCSCCSSESSSWPASAFRLASSALLGRPRFFLPGFRAGAASWVCCDTAAGVWRVRLRGAASSAADTSSAAAPEGSTAGCRTLAVAAPWQQCRRCSRADASAWLLQLPGALGQQKVRLQLPALAPALVWPGLWSWQTPQPCHLLQHRPPVLLHLAAARPQAHLHLPHLQQVLHRSLGQLLALLRVPLAQLRGLLAATPRALLARQCQHWPRRLRLLSALNLMSLQQSCLPWLSALPLLWLLALPWLLWVLAPAACHSAWRPRACPAAP